MTNSVFDVNSRQELTGSLFFGDPVAIARYDRQKYPQLERFTEKQNSFFWRPQEVDITRDSKDFRSLGDHEKHIFTSTLKRQILLDSVQGRAPAVAFLPIVSQPELETWIMAWTYFETIHSRSYTHIIRNVYPDPSVVFDGIMDIKEIVDCARDISRYYDDLIEMNNNPPSDQRDHKRALWLALNAVNALEGVRFYVSFACSWAFAELKKMEGNAKIIRFIARDENLHLAGTQALLKILPKDDPDFKEIAESTREECERMFDAVVEQEKQWARFLFKDGPIIGLNEKLLEDYVDYIATKRVMTIGLTPRNKVLQNPLPWTQRWLSGAEVQVAPQEVELSNYQISSIKKDVDRDALKGFSL